MWIFRSGHPDCDDDRIIIVGVKCSLLSVSPTFYDKRDDFTFPLVNFPFISSNIPALPGMEFKFHNSYIILENNKYNDCNIVSYLWYV
jgi:hypothetical protein